MLSKYCLRVRCLVVEGDIGTAVLHKSDLLLRARRANDLQAITLGKLYDRAISGNGQ